MPDLSRYELYLTAASFLILGIYHSQWIYRMYRKPMTTSVGITNHLRGHWVQSIMEERRDILAVQTLRNLTMAASFLASTGILICLGLLSVAASPEKMAEITPGLNEVVREHRVLWLFKLMVLIIDFFFIFFSFCLAIRYLNHVNFMINVPFNLAHKITPEYITKILNRGMMHYTMGMHGYYFSVLLFLWLFGPIWMLLGTIVMTIILSHLDRQA
jgi:uncharacterized membrane protein